MSEIDFFLSDVNESMSELFPEKHSKSFKKVFSAK